jgi:hypothetical protein
MLHTSILICVTNWLHTRKSLEVNVYVTTDGQSASLSWCQAPHLGLKTRFVSESCRIPDVEHPFWSEDGSVTIAAGPCQRSHSRVRVTVSDSWPPTWRARNRVAQLYSQALDSLLVASYGSQGYSGGIRTRPTRKWKSGLNLSSIKIQFVPHMKHITSTLQSQPVNGV